jgi:hypothetical protein
MTYPYHINYEMRQGRDILEGQDFIADFMDCHVVSIETRAYKGIQIIRLVNKDKRISYTITLKNYVVSTNSLHVNQVLKFTMSFGTGSSGAFGLATDAGYTHEEAQRFLMFSVWDHTDPVIPNYASVAEEIVIEREELMPSANS